jgi:hypothetical protein
MGSTLGKWLLVLGVVIAAVGALFWLAGRHLPWLGNLPGDLQLDQKGGTFHFPIVTCIVASVALTILVNVVMRIFRR